MIDRNTARTTGLLAAGVAAGFLLVSGADALAGPKAAKKGKRGAVVSRLELPLGLQGLRGAGPNVVIPFTLVDPTRKPTDVQAEFGVDINGDGSITDDEYRPASEDRLDPRDTRRDAAPQLRALTHGHRGLHHAG